MEEEKTINTQEMRDKTLKEVEKLICEVNESGITTSNLDYLYRLVDIHKDLIEECYREEKLDMMYRNNGYGEDSYGRRSRDSRGRYRDGDSYGRRGVRGSGRSRYRGEDALDEMMYHYSNYRDGADSYGAEDNETMESFKQMIKAFKKFGNHLKQEAVSPEQMEMLEDTAREMLER